MDSAFTHKPIVEWSVNWEINSPVISALAYNEPIIPSDVPPEVLEKDSSEQGCAVNASWNGNTCECDGGYTGDGYKECKKVDAEASPTPSASPSPTPSDSPGPEPTDSAEPTASAEPTTPDPQTVTCWDGSVASDLSACPGYVVCSDGSWKYTEADCPAPQPTPVSCWDGSTADSVEACPAYVVCSDGTWHYTEADCPAPSEPPAEQTPEG